MRRIIAITGPSGAGKTTLGNIIKKRHKYAIPKHCTTRCRRQDDTDDFYRFLTHENYAQKVENQEFFLTSGDGPEIKKEYGNFYGILKEDCENMWKNSDTILIFVSYRDIIRLQEIKSEEKIIIKIVNITFTDIKRGVLERITKNNSKRNHTTEDIQKRAQIAYELQNKYGKILEKYTDITIYSDLYDIEEIYKIVMDKIEDKT